MELQTSKALPPEALSRRSDPAELPFASTKEAPAVFGVPGQERAMEALEFAMGMAIDGHNVFVLGPAGVGRHTVVRGFLRNLAAGRETPNDWCYVYNFDDPRRPRALSLPPGVARELRSDVEHMIQDAQTAIPVAFESDDFQAQQIAIHEEFKEAQDAAFSEVEKEAKARQIGVVPTPNGIVFLPARDGEPVDPDEYEKLPEEEKEKIRKDIDEMTVRMQRVMRTTPKRAREMRQKLRQLEREVVSLAVTGLLDELLQKYTDLPAILDHLRALQEDIVENARLFLSPPTQAAAAQPPDGGRGAESAAMRRYAINVLVDRSEESGAPVIIADHPSFSELIGKIEHQAEFGTLVTNFNLIRPGALHQANGGFLIVDAAKLLAYPGAWDALKRAMKSGNIRIRPIGDDLGFFSTVSLEPEPIPFQVKVALIGERIYYYLLAELDPEFLDLFKVAADFEDDIPREAGNIQLLSGMLARLADEKILCHLSREAVARLMDESARDASDSERLSADLRRTADLASEASYWAKARGSELVGEEDVDRAVESRFHRASRVRDRMLEETVRETLVVETDGERIGQINGLAVLQMGDFAFARPQRITATVTLGSGDVVDIEREVELGGPLHSKGVLILAGFLRSHYLPDLPLSLSASLVFEQSYSGVEGDSASVAELCALASSLADAPISQSLAVTGSVDQHGRVQAIGGVNQKIEGFFDLCKARGLTGRQGVVIPQANVKHLMLRREVVEAVRAGKFRVWPVSHVDQCLELLTGLPAGIRDESGAFPEGSVNRRIEERLRELATRRREFSASKVDDGD